MQGKLGDNLILNRRDPFSFRLFGPVRVRTNPTQTVTLPFGPSFSALPVELYVKQCTYGTSFVRICRSFVGTTPLMHGTKAQSSSNIVYSRNDVRKDE